LSGERTGQAGNNFALDLGGFAAAAVFADALDLEDLLAMGKTQVARQGTRGPNAAGFDASVSVV